MKVREEETGVTESMLLLCAVCRSVGDKGKTGREVVNGGAGLAARKQASGEET